MLKLIIEDDEGRKTVVPFVRDEITIGRQEGNTIRLTERNVSRRHARLLRQNGHVVVEDLGSYNGIRVNGEKIAEQTKVHSGDLIQIGDYDLAIQDELQAQAPQTPQAPVLHPAHGNGAHANGNGHAHSNGHGTGPHAAQAVAQAAGHSAGHSAAQALDEGYEDTLRSRKAVQAAAFAPSNIPEAETDTATPILEASDGQAMSQAEREQRRQSTAVIRIDQVEGTPRRAVQNIDPAEAPRLVVMNTDFAGREFACIRTELRLGRTEENDIQLDHRSMSRSHAKLVRDANGEWKVIDLQSANGIRINGEQYGQAVLASGDVVELGHVKLKFLAAGERFVAESAGGSGLAGARKGLGVYLAAAGVAVLVLVITAVWVLTRPKAPEHVGDATVPQAATTAANTSTSTSTTTTTLPASATAVPSAEPEPATPEKIAAVKDAMAARDFDRALDILDPMKRADGTYPSEVTELVDNSESELAAKQTLESAEEALESGNLDEALSLLAQAQGTEAFTREYDRLKQRTDAAVKAEAQRNATKKPTTKPVADVRPVASNPSSESAQQYLDEGMLLLKKRQFAQARDSLTRCLKVDKKMALCHLYLGSAFAKLRDPDTAAKHYQAFVDMAPDHPNAAKIREFLDDWNEKKR